MSNQDHLKGLFIAGYLISLLGSILLTAANILRLIRQPPDTSACLKTEGCSKTSMARKAKPATAERTGVVREHWPASLTKPGEVFQQPYTSESR